MGWSSVSASRALGAQDKSGQHGEGHACWSSLHEEGMGMVDCRKLGAIQFRFSLGIGAPTLLKAKMRPIQCRHPNHCDGSDGHCRPSRCGGPVHVRKVKCRLHLTHNGSQFSEPDGYRHSVACLPDRWLYMGVQGSQSCSFDAARGVRHRAFRRRAGAEGFLGRLPTVRTGLNYRSEGVEIGKMRRKTVT